MSPSEPIDLVVRGGTVVNADWQGTADVLVGGGKVLGVVEPGAYRTVQAPGTTEIDASGRLVLPGGVDPHCHVGFTSGDFTSLDDYRQATTAAVFGGTTTIVDFAIPRPARTRPTSPRPNAPRLHRGCATARCTGAWSSGTTPCRNSCGRWPPTASSR
ncbi:hypothetical protein ACRAWF_27020 [Streptomyces sp. L7]